MLKLILSLHCHDMLPRLLEEYFTSTEHAEMDASIGTVATVAAAVIVAAAVGVVAIVP